jgi:hypothetical protein
MAMRGIIHVYVTVMAVATKNRNRWPRQELIIFYGNEGIGIEFDGNQGIFSFLYYS